MEYWPGINDWDVEIISSDIDTQILNRAKIGNYSKRSIDDLPLAILNRYFTKTDSSSYQIIEDLRESIEFTRVNLMDEKDTKSYRNFDVIFCRNLLIYFDDTSRKYASDVFFDALNPKGFICLGHSESMSRISQLFQVRKFPKAIVYQKPVTR